MALQKAVKSYPMVKWFVVVAVVLLAVGLVLSRLVTDPDDAEPMTLIWFAIPAVLLPFLAMAFPRREVVTLELPSDHLGAMSKAELEGVLAQLDAANAKGELDDARYHNARQRILAAIKAKGQGKSA